MRTRLHLTHADHGRELSWDDFIGADFEEGYRYEMIEGRVFVSPAPDMPHEDIKEWLETALRAYGQERPDVLGRVKWTSRAFLEGRTEGVTAPEPAIACYADYPTRLPKRERNWRNVSPSSFSKSSRKTTRTRTSTATAASTLS